MIFVPHLHSNKGLSFEDREMFKKQHQEIMNEFKESNNLLNDIKPNEYELEIKELNNLNKQLKEENTILKQTMSNNSLLINENALLKSIIKEVREYIEKNQEEHKYTDRGGFTYTEGHFLRDSDTLLEILDKEVK